VCVCVLCYHPLVEAPLAHDVRNLPPTLSQPFAQFHHFSAEDSTSSSVQSGHTKNKHSVISQAWPMSTSSPASTSPTSSSVSGVTYHTTNCVMHGYGCQMQLFFTLVPFGCLTVLNLVLGMASITV